jgi:hypothetical protein
MAVDRSENMIGAIQEVIARKAKDIEEEEIKAAVKMFERRLRDAVGQAAISVSNFFSVQRLQNEIIIHVKIEGGK